MADVFLNNIAVPRIARNKRIYAGNTAISQQSTTSAGAVIDWAAITEEQIALLRSVLVDGDLTIANLAGNEGDLLYAGVDGEIGLQKIVSQEEPAGVIDDVNTDFTLSNSPVIGSVEVFLNGQKQAEGVAYTINGAIITFSNPPSAVGGYTDIIRVNYRYVSYLPPSAATPATGQVVPYTAMIRGSAAIATDFDIKISRVGRSMTITGQFKQVDNAPQNSVIAEIPLDQIAVGYSLSAKIWMKSNEISSDIDNRGVQFFVDTFNPTSKPNVKLLVDREFDGQSELVKFTQTFNVI